MMGRLGKRLFGARAETVVDSASIRKGDGVWEALVGGSGGAPSESEALAVSAVYACVTLRAGAISALPMHIYQRSYEGELTRDMQSPLWWILNEQFCPRWSAAAGWSFLIGSRLLRGDGFAEILRGPGGRVEGLVPLHPDRVRVLATADGARLVYEVQPDPTILVRDPAVSVTRVLDQDDILHISGFGFNGLRSLSPLRHALRVTGRLAINAQDFSASFLKNMARPDFVLQAKGNLTDAQFSRLQEMLGDHTGPSRSGKPMLLEGGLELKPLTMALEDMQLLETRRFQVEEICRIYGVPPFMVGHTDKTTSWGSGVGEMGRGFVRFTLRDDLNTIQNEVNRKLFRRATPVAAFDTTELEEGDLKSVLEAMRVALGRAGEAPIMSVEEVRTRLRMPRKMAGAAPMQGQTGSDEEDGPDDGPDGGQDQ
jgi:HK97 family phage portal protein